MKEVQQLLFHEKAAAKDVKVAIRCIKSLNIFQQINQRLMFGSIPIAAVGSVFSLNVRPAAWRNAVERFCEFKKWDCNSDAKRGQKCENFVSLFPKKITGKVAKAFFGNEQLTSTTNGILKAEAAVMFVKALSANSIQTKKDLSEKNILNVFREVRQIPGQSSGITFVYFLMLSGFGDFVKPDRQINRFINKCLERKVRPTYAAEVVRQSAYELSKTPAELDLAIFSSMTK